MTVGEVGKSFDRVAHCYDETRALPTETLAAVVKGLAEIVRRLSPAPRLLELGIGTGRIAVPLAEAGISMVGVDIAPAMLAHLHARRPGFPVALADAGRLPFGAATFDAALFTHVLHLLPEPASALRAARDVVRPGGLLLYGREDRDAADSPLAAAWTTMRAIASELADVPRNDGPPHARDRELFVSDSRARGRDPAEIVLARWAERMTGRRLLEIIAGRVWSSTWDIPEAIMPELLRRLTPQVAALVGDLDRPIERAATFTMMVASRS